MEPSSREAFIAQGLDAKKKFPVSQRAESISDFGSVAEVSNAVSDHFSDELDRNAEEDEDAKNAELELLKALEAAKAEMKMRQLPAEKNVRNATAVAPVTSAMKGGSLTGSTTAFGWDSTNGDDGDDWEADDLTTLNSK